MNHLQESVNSCSAVTPATISQEVDLLIDCDLINFVIYELPEFNLPPPGLTIYNSCFYSMIYKIDEPNKYCYIIFPNERFRRFKWYDFEFVVEYLKYKYRK